MGILDRLLKESGMEKHEDFLLSLVTSKMEHAKSPEERHAILTTAVKIFLASVTVYCLEEWDDEDNCGDPECTKHHDPRELAKGICDSIKHDVIASIELNAKAKDRKLPNKEPSLNEQTAQEILDEIAKASSD